MGGMFDVAHGAGLAAVWGSWARYVFHDKPERFAQFASRIFDIECHGNARETALLGIEAMEEFYRSIDMPTTIRELGVALTEEQIEELAAKCAFGGRTIGAFKTHANYYNFYSNQKWGSPENYHLMLESSAFGIENSIDLICKAVEMKENAR